MEAGSGEGWTMRWRFWGMLGAVLSLAQGISAQEARRQPVPAVPVETIAAQPDMIGAGASKADNQLPEEPFAHGELLDYTNGVVVGPQFYTELDYLIWWVSKNDLSEVTLSLVTQGQWSNPAPGALSQPGTKLVGPYPGFDYGAFKGGKLILGGWLDPEQTVGVEFSGVLLEQRSVGQLYNGHELSPGTIYTNPLKVPYPVLVNGLPVNSQQTSTAALLKNSGVLGAPVSSFTTHTGLQMWTGDVNWMANWGRTEYQTFDLLFGFRQMQIQEGLSLSGSTVYAEPVNGQRTVQTGIDSVASTNSFYGGQFGGRITERFGRFKLDVTGKIALGGVSQNVLITGSNTSTVGGFSTTTPGYVYTQTSNIGRSTARHFAVLPEIYTKVSLPITEHFNLGIGYSFMYLSSVARSGLQLDPVRNAAYDRPTRWMKSDGFWAQGVMFTGELQF